MNAARSGCPISAETVARHSPRLAAHVSRVRLPSCRVVQRRTPQPVDKPSRAEVGRPLERAPHLDLIDYWIIAAASEFRISTSWCETATKDGVGSVKLANPIEPPA